MSTHRPLLPSEILHAIVSRAIAHHLDDVLAESVPSPVALFDGDTAEQMGTLVVALLAASYQVRQTTFIVLANTFGVGLSRVGIWRLEEKPWPKVESVRRLLRRQFDFGVEKDILIRLMVRSGCPEPPVLAVCLYSHVLGEIAAHPFGPLVLPVQGGGEPLTADSESVAHYFEVHAQNQYAACPAVFREYLWRRLDNALAASTIARTYGKVMTPIDTIWGHIEDAANSFDSDTPPAVVTALNHTLCTLAATLQNLRTQEDKLLRLWAHDVPADVAIGRDRLTEWLVLFEGIAEWDYDSESADELRETALDFAEDLHARLVDLSHLGRASEAHAERAGAPQAELYVAASDS